jgi:asparagine synthase (glutamine-hydrolysing)
VPPEEAAALLARMTGSIAHRGPDGEGVYVSEGIGLAHRRLAIVGLDDGQQPMSDASGHLHVTFNGEIFNYVELRDELIARGRVFRTASDTEVLLQLYDEFGVDCLAHLNGDFAFAIWDARKRRLFAARDRMGVRPLFHTVRGETLFFASEIKSLLEVPGIEAAPDPRALDQIFTLWTPIAPQTMFQGVEELPPGHCLLAEDGKSSIRPYWSIEYPDAGAGLDPRREDEIAEGLLELLIDATRIRMRADVPVGSYLSGGLDSSAVTAMATRMAPARLRTFSVTFASPAHDEGVFQKSMVDALGTSHASIMCRHGDIADVFPEVVRHAERPMLRTASAPLYLLSRLVSEQGCKVVLTGEGADEIFAGYDIFKEAKVRRFVGRQPGSRLRPLLYRRLYPYLSGIQQQSPEYLRSFFGVGVDRLDDALFSHRPRFRTTAAARTFFSNDLRALLGDYDATADLASRLPSAFHRWHPQHQAQYLETSFLLPGYILSSQGDRMAMAHGVEGRFPFLDHRLVEFASRVPVGMTLKGLVEKHILRRAVKDQLPPAIAKRVKQPYRAPDSQSFVGDVAPYADQLLSPQTIASGGLFDSDKVSRLVAKCTKPGGTDGFRDNAAFVGILSTQLWQEHFINRSAAFRQAA